MSANVLRLLTIVIVSWFFSAANHWKSPVTNPLKESLIESKIRLDSAVTHGNKQLLLETKAQIQQLVPQVADKELSVLASYYTAYANYRLSSIFEDMEKEQQEDYLNTSIEQLEQVTEEAPEFAEGWALLGNCYGMKAKGMISGMRYGPKSERTIDRARELAPDNPRVAMIYGISLLYKPGMFGGSVKKAVDTFKKAGRYFEEWSPQNSLYPEWGKAENYAWMAQAYIEQDRLADAREAYQTSLQVDPDYYWVKEVLLPELINEMDD